MRVRKVDDKIVVYSENDSIEAQVEALDMKKGYLPDDLQLTFILEIPKAKICNALHFYDRHGLC